MSSGSVDVIALVAQELQNAGLPLESAEMFAHIAVDEVRKYIWRVLPCTCDTEWRDQNINDPRCSAHDYDVVLGGNGDGGFLSNDQQRERLILHAIALRERFGEEVYRDTFAPVYAKLLREMNKF